MTLPRCSPLCCVLIDIGSSCSVTLPYFYQEVCPSLREELARIAACRGGRRLWAEGKLGDSSTPPLSSLRPCAFAAEHPRLQHNSWHAAWAAYLQELRRRWRLPPAAPGPAEDVPLMGAQSPLIRVPLMNAGAQAETEMTMEFFRVDVFIPIHVQMCHVMRRILGRRDLPRLLAVGVVTPTQHTEYFVQEARRINEKLPGATLLTDSIPSILVYDSKGLQFRSL